MKLWFWSWILPFALFIFNRLIDSKYKKSTQGIKLKREALNIVEEIGMADEGRVCRNMKSYWNKKSLKCNAQEQKLNKKLQGLK